MAKQTEISATMTAEEYLTEREWSNIPVILVEGDDDSIFFQLILDNLIEKSNDEQISIIAIQIDTVAIIKSPESQVMGNREKVEYVCQLAESQEYKGKLVGFVDREFRKFLISNPLIDEIQCQKKTKNLVWSRGHSIENYFFEYAIMRNRLRDFAISNDYDVRAVLDLFKDNFNSALQIACALSLAAKDNSSIPLVERSIDWKQISLPDELQFKSDVWKDDLKNRHHLDDTRRNALVKSYHSWSIVTQRSDTKVIRWLCHGHITFAFLWAVFRRCIFEICDNRSIKQPERQVEKVKNVSKGDRFKAFSAAWIDEILPNYNQDTPLDCFQLLGIDT